MKYAQTGLPERDRLTPDDCRVSVSRRVLMLSPNNGTGSQTVGGDCQVWIDAPAGRKKRCIDDVYVVQVMNAIITIRDTSTLSE